MGAGGTDPHAAENLHKTSQSALRVHSSTTSNSTSVGSCGALALFKNSAGKWTSAAQTHTVQGLIVYAVTLET